MLQKDPKIEFISPEMEVSMGDTWFEVVHMDHFWIRRRCEILQGLAGAVIADARQIGEIGCGNGIVQRQIESIFGKSVDGFDLNTNALKNNLSQRSRVIRYDICENRSEMLGVYDVMLMLDVLEHIADEDPFLYSANRMLAKDGYMVINVPAFKKFYSRYDSAVGHIRRYTIALLSDRLRAAGFACVAYSYWGLPLLPLLLLRKLLIRNIDESTVIQRGMSPGPKWSNEALMMLSRLERVPNHRLGTSLMAVFRKVSDAKK